MTTGRINQVTTVGAAGPRRTDGCPPPTAQRGTRGLRPARWRGPAAGPRLLLRLRAGLLNPPERGRGDGTTLPTTTSIACNLQALRHPAATPRRRMRRRRPRASGGGRTVRAPRVNTFLHFFAPTRRGKGCKPDTRHRAAHRLAPRESHRPHGSRPTTGTLRVHNKGSAGLGWAVKHGATDRPTAAAAVLHPSKTTGRKLSGKESSRNQLPPHSSLTGPQCASPVHVAYCLHERLR